MPHGELPKYRSVAHGYGWRSDPITEAQRKGIAYRRRLVGMWNLDGRMPQTKGEASEEIEQLDNIYALIQEECEREMLYCTTIRRNTRRNTGRRTNIIS